MFLEMLLIRLVWFMKCAYMLKRCVTASSYQYFFVTTEQLEVRPEGLCLHQLYFNKKKKQQYKHGQSSLVVLYLIILRPCTVINFDNFGYKSSNPTNSCWC